MSNPLPEIHALWIGTKLGEISRCCLTSFLLRGHNVFLHTYSSIEDVPEGVVCCDANLIIDEKHIFKHEKTGSFALFSDVFRYELLKKIDGIYVDCDIYCLKPMALNPNDYIFGYETNTRINGAVLGMPRDSELLSKLLDAAYDPYFIPPWYKKKRQYKLKIKKTLGLAVHIKEMPWGVLGPALLTHFIDQLGLEEKVQPIDVFYPVHGQCINLFLDKNLTINDIITKRTVCVHLYHEVLRKVDLQSIDSNSILSTMLRNKV